MSSTEHRKYSTKEKTRAEANYHLRVAQGRVESLLNIISELKLELKKERDRADKAERLLNQLREYL